MSDLIDFQIDLKVADGQLETFKGLVAEMYRLSKLRNQARLFITGIFQKLTTKALY